MDPITTAVITATTAGVAGGATVVGKEAIVDAYKGLKAMIKKKFGPKLEKAVSEVEANPDSKGRLITLEEEVENAKAVKDAEIVEAAQKVLQLINPQQSGGNTFSMSGNFTGGIQGGNIGKVTVNQNLGGKDHDRR